MLSTWSPVYHGHRPAASCDTSLVVSGGVDCERRRRNVYDKKPQRYTEDNSTAHLTARSDKSVAYVTNNKRLCSTFCTVEANYWTKQLAQCGILYMITWPSIELPMIRNIRGSNQRWLYTWVIHSRLIQYVGDVLFTDIQAFWRQQLFIDVVRVCTHWRHLRRHACRQVDDNVRRIPTQPFYVDVVAAFNVGWCNHIRNTRWDVH